MVGNIISEIAPYLGIEQDADYNPTGTVTVQTCLDYTWTNAQVTLNRLGLKHKLIGPSSGNIVYQYPVGGSVVPAGSTIYLYTATDQNSMTTTPDVVGKTGTFAEQMLKAANLNVQAVYTVNSASLNDLIADASSSRGNVRVNCLLNLSGNLTSPSLTFGLELPTVSEEDRELVRSLTSTEEQMNTQIIYLLGVGKFYTYDYANNTGQTDATSSLAFSTLSGQLNNMLSQVIDNQNWNVGTNLTTGEKGWSDVEAEAILSGRLLNNRLIINGNFGYRENTMRNTNFVGDFEAIWLLTKNGEFRLRGYNQTNDRYFTKSTLTTQGIGIMYKKDFMNWKELVDWFLRRRKNRSSKQKEKEDQKYLPQEALPAAREKRESNEK